ncbi:Moenomycin biosynthesis protein MoeGT1 [Streptomyces sp. AK02-01A]|uniref:Moenomycin biosynthesis protein MoeGT1 n=1 Tax=Streptomyces sp. AK02-01A TaxID=3028648 RepID=UPI0029AA4402|nr:Moenomycin biosynthesis protein MoeGT1 [Streptomyces sp. AK02-01A]MDX3852341.1 Moenomycin biosynthesis protein MoeGT1 [Streptomyces sp. AK02-01A]
MPSERVHVLSPKTWGEFGNFLAATRFSRALRGALDVEVTLLEAETFLPWLGDIGAQIRTISLESPDTATRTERYLALMSRLQQRFPKGFETDPGPEHASALTGLVKHLRETGPELVVGTKGFVARLCVAASRLAGVRTAVAHHLTNPGLLDLPLHRSPHPDLTLVGFPWAKDRLVAEEGADPDRIRTVGPLVAQHDLSDFMTDGSGPRTSEPWGERTGGENRPKVIVFCNRGGETYLRVLEHIARHHPATDLVFVGYDDPALARRAAAAASGARLGDWRFHSRLTQAEYFDYISQASKSPHGLLISKAGPNTTLEAAYFGIPVLMLESGLPMESWVPGLIRDHRLGAACASPEELLSAVDDWLGHPATIERHQRAALSFADTVLDQEAVVRRIGAAVRTLLDER